MSITGESRAGEFAGWHTSRSGRTVRAFCKSYAQSTTQMASAYYYTPAAGNPQNSNMAPMHNMNQMQIGIQPNAYGQPPYRGQVPINDPSAMRKRMPSKVGIDSLQIARCDNILTWFYDRASLLAPILPMKKQTSLPEVMNHN